MPDSCKKLRKCFRGGPYFRWMLRKYQLKCLRLLVTQIYVEPSEMTVHGDETLFTLIISLQQPTYNLVMWDRMPAEHLLGLFGYKIYGSSDSIWEAQWRIHMTNNFAERLHWWFWNDEIHIYFASVYLIVRKCQPISWLSRRVMLGSWNATHAVGLYFNLDSRRLPDIRWMCKSQL